MGTPFALDYAAVMMMAMAAGADVALIREVLPAVEAAILSEPGSEEE